MWFKYVRPVLVAAVTMMVTASVVVAQEKKGVPPSDPALNTLVAAFAGVALETLRDPATINQLIIEDPQVLESYRAQLQRATSGYLARVSNPDPRVVTRLASLQMALQAAIIGDPNLVKGVTESAGAQSELSSEDEDMLKEFIRNFVCAKEGLDQLFCILGRLLSILTCIFTGGLHCLVSVLGDALWSLFCASNPNFSLCKPISSAIATLPSATINGASIGGVGLGG